MPRRSRAFAWSFAFAASIVVLAVGSGSAVNADCWRPPVAAAVIDPFRRPECPWCPGNRGVEYGSRPGDPVRAVAGGVVTFAGTVAGVGYVVVRHPDGRKVTYGNVASVALRRRDRVVRHQRLGEAAGPLHFGLRSGDQYLDPTPHLGVLQGRPRLVPIDGTARRPAPPPVLRCG